MPPMRKLTKERLLARATQLEERATASEIARRTGHPKKEIERLAAEWKIRLAPDRAGPGTPAGPRALTTGSDLPNSTDSREGPGTLAPQEYLEQQSLLADAAGIGAEMRAPLTQQDADRVSSSDLFQLKRLIHQVASKGPRWPLPRLRLVVSDMKRLLHNVKEYRSVLLSYGDMVRERDARSREVASLADAEKAGRAAVEQITRQRDILQATMRGNLAEYERKMDEAHSTLWVLESEVRSKSRQLDAASELSRQADLELQDKRRQIAQADEVLETLAVKTREAQERFDEVKAITPEIRDAAYRTLAAFRRAPKKLREHERVLDRANRRLWGELTVVSSPEPVRPALPSPSAARVPEAARSPEIDWELFKALPIPLPDEPPRPRGAVGFPVPMRAVLAVARPKGETLPTTTAERAAPLDSSDSHRSRSLLPPTRMVRTG